MSEALRKNTRRKEGKKGGEAKEGEGEGGGKDLGGNNINLLSS